MKSDVILKQMNNLFEERLKTLRKEKKLSQDELGKALNIHGRTIGYYESGQRKPSPDILCEIADYFNVSVDFLLARTSIRNYEELQIQLSLDQLPEDGQKELIDYSKFLLGKYIK